jgi:hypothetical protein
VSADPGFLVVREAGTGRPVKVSTKIFPEAFKPEVWYGNVYWRYSGMVSEDEIRAYLDNRLGKSVQITPALAAKLALYVETFAKHMAMEAWLFSPGKEKEGYEKEMTPFIQKITEMRKVAKSADDVSNMVSECMDAGLDPL